MLLVRFEVGVSLLLAQKRPQGPFSSSGKCWNTAGNSQESTRQSSSGGQVLLKALYSYAQCLQRNLLIQVTCKQNKLQPFLTSLFHIDFINEYKREL